ncbi:DUF4236 domain-containing protein [Geomonas sp. Red32]|uniref:DUF4236 domain-containing protein n=1 Tax=Geomonas sp. Red32 TaxID=2912856 RepID=UPI00202CDA91|nr:DUF4236 domain-containing protein [Geomonas sp. Red32]MCM0083948.1 DUF4236 domain-containing protein [Geomonas sp. Red32]
MAFRFRKTIKVLPGVSVNLGKTGVSVSAGVKGAKVTVNSKGVRKTVGVPGTGLSWTEYQSHGSRRDQPSANVQSPAPTGGYSTPGKILAAVVFLMMLATCVAKMPK